MDPNLINAIMQLLLTVGSSFLPGATQNQENLQQSAANRQLTASDFANDPNKVSGRLGNLLGLPGANPGTAGGGVGGISGALQALLAKFTPQTSQALTNNTWEAIQSQLASSGFSQAPGIAASELATNLAPLTLQEQQLGANEASSALGSALNTETTGLNFPYQIGANGAGSFPSFQTL